MIEEVCVVCLSPHKMYSMCLILIHMEESEVQCARQQKRKSLTSADINTKRKLVNKKGPGAI